MDILFSQHALEVMNDRGIKKEWVFETLNYPSLKEAISTIEERYFKQIDVADKRCLKVVYNPLDKRVVTVYFDRNMRKKDANEYKI